LLTGSSAFAAFTQSLQITTTKALRVRLTALTETMKKMLKHWTKAPTTKKMECGA
jgi:hypothetical protein